MACSRFLNKVYRLIAKTRGTSTKTFETDLYRGKRIFAATPTAKEKVLVRESAQER